MAIEGQLTIDLYREKGAVIKVDIQSSRPLKVVSVLEGKRVGEVLELLPRLFNVCATAQGVAATRACQRAMGRKPVVAVEAAREMLLLIEAAREHLWRIALNWPMLLGETGQSQWAASLSTMLADTQMALFGKSHAFSLDATVEVDHQLLKTQLSHLKFILASEIYGCPSGEWLNGLDMATWRDWARNGDTPASRLVNWVRHSDLQRSGSTTALFLPALSEMELHEKLSGDAADRFVARPDWNGKCLETTSLVRQAEQTLIKALISEQGYGIETRLAAKLVELATIQIRLLEKTESLNAIEEDTSENPLPKGEGIGQVEAARGRLAHWVRIDDDIVKAYRILAPTEWNFHPDGVVARSLQSLPGEDDHTLRQMALLLIETIDPCVGFELTLH